MPRRRDWTPVKSTAITLDTPDPADEDIGFSTSMWKSYSFDTSVSNFTQKATSKSRNDGDLLKRKRIDIVMATETPTGTLTSRAGTTKKQGKGSSGGKVKTKAAARKPLTITGLATSAYSNGQQIRGKLPLMLETLTATQAATGSDPEAVVDVSLKKLSARKVPTKRARAAAKASGKSRLVSPTSAMKATSEQAYLFGSASQLAMDESPIVRLDALATLEHSEKFSSDPISPQRTQQFSIESTSPKVIHGTAQLVRRRNLWGAAHRDTDNALLQVETMDLTDSPAVRDALAGKDALMQFGHFDPSTRISLGNGTLSSISAATPCTKTIGSPIDIDDITTPVLLRPAANSGKSFVRAMHTSRTLEEGLIEKAPVQALPPTEKAPPKVQPHMPSYAGMSDHELKRQVAAYHFKPVRKREKMIELLEQCWRSEQGIEAASDGEDPSISGPTHGEVLGKVHGISGRAVPKAKKPRAKRKSDPDELAGPKEPMKRKGATAKKGEDSKTGKAPRKRAAKMKPVADEDVLDVEDIGADEIDQTVGKVEDLSPKKLDRLQTPPPTISNLEFPSSSPGFDEVQQPFTRASGKEVIHQDEHSLLTPKTTPSPDIMIQVHAAINNCVDARGTKAPTGHPVPTWREKILMYDPIVLEELTVWLNTEGFRAIGEDREISPLQVRDWCEQNGVCCLGVGGGWRGRGRHPEGE